jgi:hypothetical protein
MKNFRKSQKPGTWKKVRSKTNTDIYFTYTSWDNHEVDGVLFIPAVREMSADKLQQIKYLRKDSIEYVT